MSVATPKERIKAAFRRTFADRVPSYPILGAYTTRLTGAPLHDYFTDPKTLADCQLAALDHYKPDVLVLMRDLITEAEALGSRVALLEGRYGYITHYALADEPEKLARLSPPDITGAGRFPEYWEACRRVTDQVKDVPVGAILAGPWTIAANLRSPEQLLRDTAKRPQYVRDLLDLTTQVAVDAGVVARSAGAGVSYSEPSASCSLISPRIYREFVQPVHRKLTEALKGKNISVTLHICGYIDPIVKDVLETGIVALSLDSASDLKNAFEVNRGKVVIIGNVSVASFESDTTDAVETEIRRAVDAAKDESAFILASACEIPPPVRPENVAYFARFAKEYGARILPTVAS